MVFFSHISPFFYSVALLCSAKRDKIWNKKPYFSLQSKKFKRLQSKKLAIYIIAPDFTEHSHRYYSNL